MHIMYPYSPHLAQLLQVAPESGSSQHIKPLLSDTHLCSLQHLFGQEGPSTLQTSSGWGSLDASNYRKILAVSLQYLLIVPKRLYYTHIRIDIISKPTSAYMCNRLSHSFKPFTI